MYQQGRTKEQTLWTCIVDLVVVLALVEQAANLMHPALAVVALHPSLLSLRT